MEVNRVMAHAIDVLKKKGAVIVPVSTPELDTDKLNGQLDVQKYEYKSVMNQYLKDVGSNAPAHSLDDIVASGKTHPSLSKFLQSAKGIENGLNEHDYKDRLVKIDALKIRVANVMAENHLDAMIYPHQKRLPVPIGEYDQRERNGILASLTGFPAVVARWRAPPCESGSRCWGRKSRPASLRSSWTSPAARRSSWPGS